MLSEALRPSWKELETSIFADEEEEGWKLHDLVFKISLKPHVFSMVL